MRTVTAVLTLACTASAQDQMSRAEFFRVRDARESAQTRRADSEVMAADAVFALGQLMERVNRLRSGNILSQTDVDYLDLDGECRTHYELQRAVRWADQGWQVAEDDWAAMWAVRPCGSPGKMIRQFDAAGLLYVGSLTRALDCLESIEAKNHWLDDHRDRLDEMGFK